MALSGDQVLLTEDDISGAKLEEPLESHTVSKLRWWLLCGGIVCVRCCRVSLDFSTI